MPPRRQARDLGPRNAADAAADAGVKMRAGRPYVTQTRAGSTGFLRWTTPAGSPNPGLPAMTKLQDKGAAKV